MPRKKNYNVNVERLQQLTPKKTGVNKPHGIDTKRAVLDMEALMPKTTRFTRGEKRIIFTDWIGFNIANWITVTLMCLKSLLLSGSRQTSTIAHYGHMMPHFFMYITSGNENPRISCPNYLTASDVEGFARWLQKYGEKLGWAPESARRAFTAFKMVVIEMIAMGFVSGSASELFRRGQMPFKPGGGKQTSLSDSEQERVATAIKKDLIDIHHGRIELGQAERQALRLLVVGHSTLR